MSDDEAVSRVTARYPPADLTPAEFEAFATSLFDAAGEIVSGLTVQLHEQVSGVDGTYDFDATVRYELAGMAFLVLVEAKLHTNPIKRADVQVLHAKLMSVGAQKAVLISTAPFQQGALEYALAHGIALVTVTEGRFTFETKSAYGPPPTLTREQAAERFGLPTFVGHCYSPGDSDDSVATTLMSTEHPNYIVELLLDVPQLSQE